MGKGLEITIIGMGVVFAVLIIINIGILLLKWLDGVLPAPKTEAPPPKKKRPAQGASAGRGLSGATDEELAAMKAAFAHHLNLKPDQFHIEIK